MPPSKFSSRAIEVFQSPEVEFRKPRPIGQDNGRMESMSAGIDLDPVKLDSDFPSSESFPSLLKVEGVLDQSEGTSPALSIDPPKLGFLDFGDEFNLESLQLPEHSEVFDSRDNGGISSRTPELVMSCVEAIASAPSESARVTGNESGHFVDLELAQIENYMLDTVLECNLAHYEVDPHRLQPESRHRGYGRNYSSST